MKHYTIPIFIPELACPFRCIFCDQEKISGKNKAPLPGEVKAIIDEHLATMPEENVHIEIGFFGGNFTGIPLDEQRHYLEVAQEYLRSGRIRGIRLSTRPDYISEEILELLKNYGVTTIELGAQSMDEVVLLASARGHTSEDTKKASTMIRETGFELGLQMMLGLPGDSLEKAINTAHQIVALGASNTRIYPALVIQGTNMETLYHKNKYVPLSMDEAIFRAKEVLKIFEEGGVNVIRMGLHPSEGLMGGDELIAGPFHPSFRELVMTELWWEQMQLIIQNEAVQEIEISVHPSQLNFAIGYSAKNKKRLLDNFKKVKFIPDTNMKGRDFKVSEIN